MSVIPSTYLSPLSRARSAQDCVHYCRFHLPGTSSCLSISFGCLLHVFDDLAACARLRALYVLYARLFTIHCTSAEPVGRGLCGLHRW